MPSFSRSSRSICSRATESAPPETATATRSPAFKNSCMRVCCSKRIESCERNGVWLADHSSDQATYRSGDGCVSPDGNAAPRVKLHKQYFTGDQEALIDRALGTQSDKPSAHRAEFLWFDLVQHPHFTGLAIRIRRLAEI